MGLSLLAGPAHAGKVALLLERYLARLDDEPYLIVPNRSDVDRVERDLLRRAGCLLAGEIGTFDDLFAKVADGRPPPAARRDRRAAQVWPCGAHCRRRRSTASRAPPATAGFADSLLQALSELESGLVDPEHLDGDLQGLYASYRAELEQVGALGSRRPAPAGGRAARLRPRRLARRARVRLRLRGSHGSRVVTARSALGASRGARLAAVRARPRGLLVAPPDRRRPRQARRRPHRGARPRGAHDYAHPALAHLERALFEEAPPAAPALDGAVWFLEGAGRRGTLELVGEEVLALLRSGTEPSEIALVSPSPETWRASLETVFGSLGIPYALEHRTRLGATPFGHALLELLRYAWLDAGRRELFAFLRSPYSGLGRAAVDFVEGRLRGRGDLATGARRGGGREAARGSSARPRRSARRRLAGRVGPGAPAVDGPLRLRHGGSARGRDLAARPSCVRRGPAGARGARGLVLALGGRSSARMCVAALEHADVRLGAAAEAGRVAVLDLLRARTRGFAAVFVLGLEEGSLPRRSRTSPFLDDDRRRELPRPPRAARPGQPRPLPLLHDLHARAAAALPRARGGDGRRRSARAEPVLGGGRSALRARRRRARHGQAFALRADVAARARADRARAAAGAEPALGLRAPMPPSAWPRPEASCGSAVSAVPGGRFAGRRGCGNAAVLATVSDRTTFGATELERFADCSSAWLFERIVDPKTIDAEVDPMLRGSVAHQTLFKFYSGPARRSSARTASRRRTSSRRSGSCGAASTPPCAAGCGST